MFLPTLNINLNIKLSSRKSYSHVSGGKIVALWPATRLSRMATGPCRGPDQIDLQAHKCNSSDSMHAVSCHAARW